MATAVGTKVTMYDLAELSHNGQLMNVVYPLTESQDILKDAPLFEANDLSSHRIVRNASLAAGTWRDYNEGIDPTKGRETPAREELGNIESRLEVDTGILDHERDKQGFLRRKEVAHLEGLSNDIADAIVDGCSHFQGFEDRLASLSITDAFGQTLVKTYEGTGSDLTSILAIQWGDGQVYLAYPRGHEFFGVEREDRGVERVLDGNSKAYYAYVVRYGWKGGLVIEDDRCVRRLANIETTGSTHNLLDSTNHGYVRPIIDMLISMKNMGQGAILYMNRTVFGQLWKASIEKLNVIRNPGNAWGQPEYYFGNNLVRFTDSLLITETAVS